MRNAARNLAAFLFLYDGVCRRRQALLHSFVVGAAAPFRDNPVDDLVGVGDVAGFAVHAVGEINFEFGLAGGVFGHFVNGRGTEILAGIAVFDDAFRGANI